MQYKVNDTVISYEATGDRELGGSKILLREAVDISAGNSWGQQGFSIEPLFSKKEFSEFYDDVNSLLLNLWRKAGLKVPDEFSPDQYHKLPADFSQHLLAIDQTKLVSTKVFPLGIEKIEQRISEICNAELEARNPYDNQSVFHFRVIRPQSNDNNPLHRDVWLEDYASCINLYIPVAGSNERSSLILIPGSHHWEESRIERTKAGALINGLKFNVPAVTSILGDYKVERPNPGLNEVLVFSPYLIHGGAVNLNPDLTRISIELRLWKNN
jgi:hypothetical protein